MVGASTKDQWPKTTYLVGGFNYFLVFTPKIGEIIHFDEHIFPTGLKPPTSFRVLGVVAYYSFLHSKMFFVVFLDPCVLHSVCFFPKLWFFDRGVCFFWWFRIIQYVALVLTPFRFGWSFIFCRDPTLRLHDGRDTVTCKIIPVIKWLKTMFSRSPKDRAKFPFLMAYIQYINGL